MTEATTRQPKPGGTDAPDAVAGAVSGQLNGTWTTELDNDGEPTFGLASFCDDGTVTAMQVNVKNIGLGNWVTTGPETFEYNFHILATDAAGAYVGQAHVYVEGRLESGARWVGVGGATFYDPQGKRLRGHSGSRVVGTKYGIDK